ncbi:MAG: SDR family oxidoreductase, partial [Pseudomonadota bacterium]|nr:SDR family oxidoreductase [Pseudomonadota bacterium]
YGLSKAADSALARNMAVEHGGDNVRTNAIAPGLIKTYFAKALWDNPEILEVATSTTPMKRIGSPDEIAGAAVFLASPAGSFVNGQTLTIDGGQVINGF